MSFKGKRIIRTAGICRKGKFESYREKKMYFENKNKLDALKTESLAIWRGL